MNDVMHQKRALRILWILKKSVKGVETRHRTIRVDFRLLAEALGSCRMRWGWGKWKSQTRKNVYLSPYVEEPLDSKVIKSFVHELRSRKCFSWFEIHMFYVYIYKHYERFAYRYEYIHFTYRYLAMVHKQRLALNNLQWLLCHETS